ncbi:hypothetical protein HB779_06950 [Phyllobacterium sp. 628]|uniref:hypothetical protein n=1 Tax=Phyllobacterium sp. 628 TaxID=2718938 RepID=UPI0016622B5B|nr:hypothetical protein [Phyllobacterium sp. 628]QND51666.1 hypothetical protein HB779_06950 [Phyllobacterium sp. 628]
MQDNIGMNQPDVSMQKSGVPANYAVLLFGMFTFPLPIYTLFVAKRQRKTGEEWEKTHYEAQYRSAVVLTIGVLVTGVLAFTVFWRSSDNSQLQQFYTQIWLSQIGKIYLLLTAWTAVRSVRGLYFAGGKRALANPKSYWVWPKAI